MVSIKTKFRFYRIFKSIASWINPFWIRRNENNEIKNDHRPLILNVTAFFLVVASSTLGYLREWFSAKQLSYWMSKEEAEQIGLGKVKEQITKTVPGEPLTRFFLKLKWFLLGCVLLTIPITLWSFLKRKHESVRKKLENDYVRNNTISHAQSPMTRFCFVKVTNFLKYDTETHSYPSESNYLTESDILQYVKTQDQIAQNYKKTYTDDVKKEAIEQTSGCSFNKLKHFFSLPDKISLKYSIRMLIETGITLSVNFGWLIYNQGTNNYNHQYAVIFPQINRTNEYGEHYARLLACVNASETVWSRGAFYPEFKNDIYIFAILYASIFAAITSISIKAALPIILDKLQSIIFLCCKKHDVESDGNMYLPVEVSDDEIFNVSDLSDQMGHENNGNVVSTFATH